MVVRQLAFGVGLLIAAGLSVPSPVLAASPAPKESARRYYQEATSAYGLGNYGQAAELYEKAFSLKADPALLYNAAQAHRMVGHTQRALELYRNYLRLFPMAEQGAEAQRHIDSLQKPATAPPAASLMPAAVVLPSAGGSSSAATAATAATTTPVLAPATVPALTGADLTATPTAIVDEPAPRRSRAWIWIAVGAAVVAGSVTAALLLGGRASDPNPTLGTLGGKR